MGITPEVKAKLESSLPPASVTQQRLLTWMRTTGVSWPLVGKLSGRSATGVQRFAAGKYHHTADTDVLIRQSIEEFLQRFPVEGPRLELSRAYPNQCVSVVREWMEACCSDRLIAVLYGPPGSGKTFSLEYCLAEFNRANLKRESNRRAYYMHITQGMRPLAMLSRLCRVVGAPASNRILNCQTNLELWLKEYQIVLVIDEAQRMPFESLEVLRDLHDHPPHAGMLLAGSHKLARFLKENAGDMEQWNSRIDVSLEMPRVDDDEATAIIRGEMPQAGPRNIAELLRTSVVQDLYGGKQYTSLRRLTDTINARKSALAQKEGVQ